MKKRSAAVVALAGLLAATGIATSMTGAPGEDERFARFLAEQGVPVASDGAAVAGAHRICTKLESGQTLVAVLMETGAANPGWTSTQAATYTGASIGAFCPEHAPAMVS